MSKQERMSAADYRRLYGKEPPAEGRPKTWREALARAPEITDDTPWLNALRRIPARKKWSNAKRTVCAYGHTHASKLEARVCDRLMAEYRDPVTGVSTQRVVRQIRLPLLAVAKSGEVPLYMTIDFAVLDSRFIGFEKSILRLIDAKGRRSREWARGKAALEASYGIKVEEITK